MLLRLIIDNFTSFGEKIEFNTFPGRQSRFGHHLYNFDNQKFVKLSSIYGANGAGKSNLVLSLWALRMLVLNEDYSNDMFKDKFKLSKGSSSKNSLLGVEFINDETAFLYAVEFSNTRIVKEELYESGLGKKENKLLFERIYRKDKGNILNLASEIEDSEEGRLLKDVVLKSYQNVKRSFLSILNELEHPLFEGSIKSAYRWFERKLAIVSPGSYFGGFVSQFRTDKEFRDFAIELMCSFNTGINEMDLESIPLKEYLGDNEEELYENIYQELLEEPEQEMSLRTSHTETVSVTLEEDTAMVHRIYFRHEGEYEDEIFYLHDESDGTKRLFEYIPAFVELIRSDRVYLIDEIERSIHPMIVKELIRKFSNYENTNGQLVFTTHESNLLDQEIFRQDEIWFIQKDKKGRSRMYPLSDFDVHHTKDIEKGYLNGRYGAIPFTANLVDLKWDKYEIA